MFRENELYAQLARVGMTQAELAEKMGINHSTLYRKIKNNGSFTRGEIAKIVKILNLDNPDDIFFAE